MSANKQAPNDHAPNDAGDNAPRIHLPPKSLFKPPTKPVTPSGGLVSLTVFFNTSKLGKVLGRLMPFAYPSANVIPPE